ncbi:uracil-DNA glycosylase [Limnoglobus roseus]|uniref:Type-4 uracil-DNA glycosylase n=1 Tax=Limnoglobus roseus TaxID=2598579 RepID=A0A5C1AJB2_9BACT|nr:uracil-DNA glycosylase [Limnoglobus roseus]QEL18096.1 uracil-DNA glycosylase [Limnoglobus roseus]
MDLSPLQKQLKQRLDALAAAGIEFLPAIAPTPIRLEQNPFATTEPVSTSLFDDVTTASVGVDDTRRQLTMLADEIRGCKKCPELFATRTQTVFGVGPDRPDICFIGEAPGADEDRQGEPFVGKAGQLLNRIITAAGLKREEIYICNVLKCRPPNNRTPAVDECKNCRPYLDRQLELLQPKVILCLGNVPTKNLLNTATGITRMRGQVYKYNGVPVVCTYHPSYIMRLEGQGEAERKAKLECWEDMKLMLKQIGREVPKK